MAFRPSLQEQPPGFYCCTLCLGEVERAAPLIFFALYKERERENSSASNRPLAFDLTNQPLYLFYSIFSLIEFLSTALHRDRPRNHELPFSLFDDGSSHQVVGICVQSRIVQRCVHFRMHAPRRTQARSTAESRIDNIIELPRFLATVAMLRLTSLVSNNCFILTRNSSVIVGIVIVVQARFIISDGQGKYQTKLKQRMKVARCSSIDRYTERSLGRTVL